MQAWVISARLGKGKWPWQGHWGGSAKMPTIDLPKDLESSLRAEVHGGHFASLDEAMAEAVRLLLRHRRPADT
jgi:hypothetical protein